MDPLIHTYARTHVHEEVGGSHQVLATLFLIYFFATGSLNEPDTIQFAKLTGRLAPGPCCSCSPSTGVKEVCSLASFYMGARNLPSGSHARIQSILSTGPYCSATPKEGIHSWHQAFC